MITIEQLAKLYDAKPMHIISKAEPPTEASIKKIENLIGFSLPKDLISFATYSEKHGNWLASIGPDFDSLYHILNINESWHEQAKMGERLPSNLWVINVGYDEDLICIDLNYYDPATKEYFIAYWSPSSFVKPNPSILIYENFYDYICNHVLGQDHKQ